MGQSSKLFAWLYNGSRGIVLSGSLVVKFPFLVCSLRAYVMCTQFQSYLLESYHWSNESLQLFHVVLFRAIPLIGAGNL